MKKYPQIALVTALLTGAFWQVSAQADTLPLDKPIYETSYDLGLKNQNSTPTTLATNTKPAQAADDSMGLKLGSKSGIEMYGTIDIGYTYRSHKN